MKNGKFFGMGLITSLVAVFVLSYFLFAKNTEVQATGILFAGETYSVTLKQPITKSSLTNGSILVVDEKGKNVKAKFSIDRDGTTLLVDGLSAGKYKLQIKKAAYAKNTKTQQDQSVPFEVLKKVEKITSTEDLKDYFRVFLATENARTYQFNDMATTEESKVSMDNSASGSGGPSYSSTNNQVEGIEEGDVTITDGRYIYTILDNKVAIVDTNDLKVVKRITIGKEIYPSHLMIHEKTLIVAYSSYIQTQKEPYDGKSVSKIAFYDVSDVKNPSLLREVGHDGNIANIRKSGNYLYVVSSLTPNYWLLQETPNVELRPSTYDGKKETILPVDKIRVLPESNQPSYLIVSAIDVSNVKKNAWTTESFLGNSGHMYMSENAIYIASMNYYGFWPVIDLPSTDDAVSTTMPTQQNNETTIYKISVNKTSVNMTAQGKVTGSVLNQFSMDEHEGHFRIATTEGNAWGPPPQANSKNHLFILDGDLKQVGAVNDLAKGERIYSARFMGDKAYLVTFRETDPLFVIDTKDPKAPKVLGELKIPGFSNYLHPIDENHLLGIGYDTEVRMEAGSKEPIVLTKGMKLSLFDVTDFNKPKEKQAVIIGGRGTYSPVQYDHKALFRDPRQNYYGFPVTIYSPTDEEDRLKYEGTGAHIYKVTPAGIELAADLIEKARPGEQYEDSYNAVQRLIYVEDQLFTVSRSKVTSFNGKTFEKQQLVGF